MNLSAREENPREIHLPAEVDWTMLDKSRFFLLGAALFSGVSATLYPAVVLKTRQQVSVARTRCFDMALLMLRQEGFRSFYRGFGTSLMGTIPARALYMAALEITKTNVSQAGSQLGLSEPTTATVASAAAGLSASMAAQLVWTPVDVVSQRLMVQGHSNNRSQNRIVGIHGFKKYGNGFDCFKKIVGSDGIRGLYRGFGISILTYAPSSAVWWGSYSLASRLIWGGIGFYKSNEEDGEVGGSGVGQVGSIASGVGVVGVQGVSAALASGISALVTMPLDTIKTRLQVLDQDGGSGDVGEGQWRQRGRRTLLRGPTVIETVNGLVKEGGFGACYRGLGPRWASMSVSAATMVTTYEFLKKMSTKHQE